MSIAVRPATPEDVDGMAAVLKSTVDSAKRPTDPDHVRAHYIDHPDRVECSVAVETDGTIVGFQSLRLAKPGNPYDLPDGWGIVGTYVLPATARRGVGAALFAATRAAAERAGLAHIDATIGAANVQGQAYYAAMGFHDWRNRPGAACKRFDVTGC